MFFLSLDKVGGALASGVIVEWIVYVVDGLVCQVMALIQGVYARLRSVDVIIKQAFYELAVDAFIGIDLVEEFKYLSFVR